MQRRRISGKVWLGGLAMLALMLALTTACSSGLEQGTSTQPNSSNTMAQVSSSHQVWIDPGSAPFSETTPAYKPTKVEIAGDGTYELRNMIWQVWNSSEAIGTGTAYIDDCLPYCANGGWHKVGVRAVFSQPVHACASRKGQGNPGGLCKSELVEVKADRRPK